jgi:hypothetical protein
MGDTMRDTNKIKWDKVMESCTSRMDRSMTDNGKTIKCMVMGSFITTKTL